MSDSYIFVSISNPSCLIMLKKFSSGYPKHVSPRDLDSFKLDKFLDRCLAKPKRYPVVVVDDNESINDTVRKYIEKNPHFTTRFFIDCTGIYNQYKRWVTIFDGVQPFYAVKCNPDEGIMLLFTTFPGACFDCASPKELCLVIENERDPDCTVYANPIKPKEGIQFMSDHKVMTCTFDCVEELDKMKEILGDEFSNYGLIFRLYVPDHDSDVPLGAKFGARPEEYRDILKKVQELDGRLIGISFHVGSGCKNFNAYDEALSRAKNFFDMAKEYGYDLSLVDLGGGWSGVLPTENEDKLVEASKIVKDSLVKYNLDQCEVIAEPGRYFVHSTICMCVYIDDILKSVNPETKEEETYYKVNEGVLGGFKDRLLCNYIYTPVPVNNIKYKDQPVSKKIILGPTEHKEDIVNVGTSLPEMEVNDWLLFPNMGDYTMSLVAQPIRDVQEHVYVISRSSLSDEAYARYLKQCE